MSNKYRKKTMINLINRNHLLNRLEDFNSKVVELNKNIDFLLLVNKKWNIRDGISKD